MLQIKKDMESIQEPDITNKSSKSEVAIGKITDGKKTCKHNKEAIMPETLKPDVNDFSDINMHDKGAKLAIRNEEAHDDVSDQNKMLGDEFKPNPVKQENNDVFVVKTNYIILGKGNGNKRFVCAICQERCGGTAHIKHHLLKRHDFVVPPKPIHKCTECQFKSGQISKVIKHMKNNHNSKELYCKCHICGYLCAQKFGLQEHIKVMHFNSMKKCNYCEFKAKYKQKIQRHVLTSHQGIELKCRPCAMTYTSIDSHRNKFHSYKSCKICMKMFKGTASLKDHKMKNHKSGKHKEVILDSINKIGKEELCPYVNKKLVKVEFVPDIKS